MRIFFDTNVIRYFGEAFSTEPLDAFLRSHIVLSPISVLEVISQLATKSRQQAFAAIQAMWHWLPERVAVLDLPPIFIRRAIFHNDRTDDEETFARITNAIQRCLYAANPDELRGPVTQLRRLLETIKQRDAETRRDAILAIRATLKTEHRKAPSEDELRYAFRVSLARRAGATPDDIALSRFADTLQSYYLYDTTRLITAVAIPGYNILSKKHKNDLFDCEQLLYLAHPHFHFMTTDRGYKHLVTFQQGERIHVIAKERLCVRQTATEELRSILDHQKDS